MDGSPTPKWYHLVLSHRQVMFKLGDRFWLNTLKGNRRGWFFSASFDEPAQVYFSVDKSKTGLSSDPLLKV